jgi:Concanavalin A-like lectin/glucanases superfamily
MPFVGSVEGALGYGRPARAAATPTGGSLYFNGASNANLAIANDADLRFGTGDFTIEWWQKMDTSANPYPRVFSIGSFNTQSIAVSLEGSSTSRTFYAWISSANSFEAGQNYTTAWIHFAISRSGTNLRIFKNGTQISTTRTNSTNFNDTTNLLRIGNEGTVSTNAAFQGYITNFHWVKGTALYTANFTKPTQPVTPVANTKLLLRATTSGTATTDSSGLGKTVTNNNITWSSQTPF